MTDFIFVRALSGTLDFGTWMGAPPKFRGGGYLGGIPSSYPPFWK